MGQTRRDFLKAAGATTLVASGALAGCASIGGAAKPRVVVIGGGYAGATAAKYIGMWSEQSIAVTLIERNERFVSCPLSNLVLGGSRTIADLTIGYDGLDKYGVRRIRDEAVAIDPQRRVVRLAGGSEVPYDRLIVAPGIDFMYDQVPGLGTAAAQERVLHAWRAGPQTVALRRQLEAMPDGGVYAMHIPRAPYRCPPGPYERACQVAWYFSNFKKKSKVLILDANEDVQSKKGLFMAAWNGKYKGLVEYRPNSGLISVDPATLTAKLDFEDVRAQVLNVIPPQRAGAIARQLGMANANERFCQVDFLTFESTVQKNVHVLGDAIQIAPLMPKSGHMANQHAKVCASAVVALLSGKPVNPEPTVANTCYSFIDDKTVVHVASVHRYDAEKKTLLVVPGSGGVSSAASELEGVYANAWARSIWSDVLA
jgi:NADPH-dependent 2,4-dienoyl-CoA reductase/sulfur reductase-like enzyme